MGGSGKDLRKLFIISLCSTTIIRKSSSSAGVGGAPESPSRASSISLSRVSKNGGQETKLINYNGHYPGAHTRTVPQMHVIFKKPMVRPKALDALGFVVDSR